MGLGHGASIVRSGLVLALDAANKKSYPGTGTAWTNLVGTEVFTINASAYNGTGPKYMDFKGSYGCAKKTDSDFIISGNVTCICWTRVLDSSTNWRTLLRGLSSGGDHQVIVASGGWDIGLYDNTNGSGFNNAGISQQNLPGYATNSWNMLTWRWKDAATPYYNFSYNGTPETIRGSINSVNARFKHGICSIGAYNNGTQTNPSSSSQFWGDISSISLYNRYLTDAEIRQSFNATRGRYGI